MKIMIVNGSPRTQGATGILLREMMNYLVRQKKVEVHYLDLATTPFEYCRGCLDCYRTGRCAVKKDRIDSFADVMKACDGIILGSPTYASNITAQLKNFMDRGHFIVEQSLQGKRGFSVSTYEIADGLQVNRVLDKFFLVAGAARKGRLTVKVEHNHNPLQVPNVLKRLHRKMDRFYRSLEHSQGKSFFEKLFTDWILVHLIWKPVMFRNPKKYAGILKNWQAKKLIQGGAGV